MKITNAEIHYGIPDDEYFGKPWLSKSFMKDMLVNPAFAISRRVNREDGEEKEHLRRGSVLHNRIWGGGETPSVSPVGPADSRAYKNTKAFKEWKAGLDGGLWATQEEIEWSDRAKAATSSGKATRGPAASFR